MAVGLMTGGRPWRNEAQGFSGVSAHCLQGFHSLLFTSSLHVPGPVLALGMQP